MNVAARVYDWLFEQRGSTRPLALFRIALVILVWTRLSADLALWNATGPIEAMVGLTLLVLGALLLVGIHTRRTAALFATTMVVIYFHLGINEGHVPFTHHHIYLLMICSVLVALGPCERSFSYDAWTAATRGTPLSENGRLTANHLIILQLAAIYFWTAVDKSNFIFLSGLRLDQILHLHYYESVFAPILLWKPLVLSASIAVVIVEYALAVLVLSRRNLRLTFGLGLLLHGSFFYLLPVQTFSATMLAMYIMLARPEAVHTVTDRIVCRRNSNAEEKFT